MYCFRNLKSTLSLLVALVLLTPSTAIASSKPLELQWGELSSKIQGRTIQLTLPGGTTVGGDVAVVRDEAIVLDIHKTSDSNAYPKGSVTIPRASVTVLKLIETQGQWGRKMGSMLGVLTGVLVGGYTAGKTANSAGTGLAMFGAITGAAAVGGYYIGKSADVRETLIRVVP